MTLKHKEIEGSYMKKYHAHTIHTNIGMRLIVLTSLTRQIKELLFEKSFSYQGSNKQRWLVVKIHASC